MHYFTVFDNLAFNKPFGYLSWIVGKQAAKQDQFKSKVTLEINSEEFIFADYLASSILASISI